VNLTTRTYTAMTSSFGDETTLTAVIGAV
jgi:hypothetical protein